MLGATGEKSSKFFWTDFRNKFSSIDVSLARIMIHQKNS